MAVPLGFFETDKWRKKYVRVAACLGPVLERLAELKTLEVEGVVAQVLPIIEEFVKHDAHEHFNRALIHGAMFGAWAEVQNQLEHSNVFVPLFRCTITTQVYTTLVQLGGFQYEMMECLYWVPNPSITLPALVSTLFHVKPKTLPSELNLENSGKEGAASTPDGKIILEKLEGIVFGSRERRTAVCDIGYTVNENGGEDDGVGELAHGGREGQACWPPPVSRFLGLCMAKMMPGHPCGLRCVFPSANVQEQLSSGGIWTPAHLTMQMLTMFASIQSPGVGDGVFQKLLPICMEIMGKVETDADQQWVVDMVVGLEGYGNIASRLSSDDAWMDVCRQGLTPLLNKVMEMGLFEDGVVLDVAEELKRQHCMFARFLPYVVLFPWTATEHLLKAGLTNPGQLNIIHQMLVGWKGILTLEHPLQTSSVLVSALQGLMNACQAFLGTDSGSQSLAALVQKLVVGNGRCVGRMEILCDVMVPCLEQYLGGSDIPVNAILIALDSIVGPRYLRSATQDLSKTYRSQHGTVDLIIALSRLFELRPRALAWGQPIPCFIPLPVIELSEVVLESALEEMTRSKDDLSEINWDRLLSLLSELSWPIRAKVVAGLGDSLGIAGGAQDDCELHPTSLKEIYQFNWDPYRWGQVIEDCLAFIASSDSHCDAFVHHYRSNSVLGSDCLERHRTGTLAKDLAAAAGECPPHLLPWCLVTSFARMLPFLTSKETARLCLKGMLVFLSLDPSPSEHGGLDSPYPAGDETLIERVVPVCGTVELMCRSIYFLTAHEDVVLVDRSEAIALALVKVAEVCEGFREMFEGDPIGMELMCGRCLREICGLIAAIQYHHSCIDLQPLILQFLQLIVEGSYTPPCEEDEAIVVTAIGVPLRVTIEWLCGMVNQFDKSMKNVVMLALDKMVHRKVTEIGAQVMNSASEICSEEEQD